MEYGKMMYKTQKRLVCEKCHHDAYWKRNALKGDEKHCPNCGLKFTLNLKDIELFEKLANDEEHTSFLVDNEG